MLKSPVVLILPEVFICNPPIAGLIAAVISHAAGAKAVLAAMECLPELNRTVLPFQPAGAQLRTRRFLFSACACVREQNSFRERHFFPEIPV